LEKVSGSGDWNDLALDLAAAKMAPLYDVIIVDETQDFSANQIRAVMNQLQTDHSATFVLDSAQRIYPRGFTWAEAGVTITSENSKRLTKNYRATLSRSPH
jgi:superfamily I DNA/RNA helicase